MSTEIPDGYKYAEAFLAGRPQHGRYDDFSLEHPKMERRRRAKIFAPFDALDGYSESIDRKNVEYVERVIPEAREREELNRRLQILQSLTYNGRAARRNRVEICVRYYVPCTDENHFAFQMKGRYVTETGICWKVDPDVTGTIKVGEAVISLSDILEITASDVELFKIDEWEGC